MSVLPKAELSLWQTGAPQAIYPPLAEDINVDVAIVGGGIAGLTIAYEVKQSGLKVAVLEQNTIASGTTVGTTGKITSQHNLFYAELQRRNGQATAQIYASANQTAVERIAELVKREAIDCDWQEADNYVYTAQSDNVQAFKTESRIAEQLGLPATFETNLDLPFEVSAAVKFSKQANFNAYKYVMGLANLVNGGGSYVFEQSQVTGFRNRNTVVASTSAAKVYARAIVVATKVPTGPLIARAEYGFFEHPHTSYIVAGEIPKPLAGMYISPDKGHYSLLPVKHTGKQLLLIGGENHTPGLGNANRRYQKLARYGKEYFGISDVIYKWKAMDYRAYDDIPLIGKLYPWSKNLYVATGFKKWGITTSMIAAIILRDAIHKQRNPWAMVFDSTRLRPIGSIPRAVLKEIRK